MIQCVGTSGCKIHVLAEVRENLLHVSLVKVPSNNENSLRIGVLYTIDVVVEGIQGYFCVCVRGYVHSNDECLNSHGRLKGWHLTAKTSISGELCEKVLFVSLHHLFLA